MRKDNDASVTGRNPKEGEIAGWGGEEEEGEEIQIKSRQKKAAMAGAPGEKNSNYASSRSANERSTRRPPQPAVALASPTGQPVTRPARTSKARVAQNREERRGGACLYAASTTPYPTLWPRVL